MTPIRIAVVGAGHLGRIHARILASLEPFDLVGVVDPVESQRQQVAAEFRTSAFARLDDVLDLIDAVVIAAPTMHHYALSNECLRRGKHTFIEKPITNNSRDADELAGVAARGGLTLQVGHVERFNPAFQAALPHLRQPRFIESMRRGPYSFRSTDVGVVFDLMIHDIDLVLSLVNSPVRQVDALGLPIIGPHEDAANARIEFANGCVASFNACRTSPTASRTMQAWTSDGFVSLDFQARTASLVRPSLQLRQRSLHLERLSPVERQQMQHRLLSEHLPVEQLAVVPADAITAELHDFARSIHTGQSPRVSGTAGRDAVAVAELVLQQIAGRADGDSLSKAA